MSKPSYPENWNDIDTGLYSRSVKIFNQVRKLLSVKMKLHAEEQVEKGDIFLFNHFSRFETFIPQFLIYEKTGAYCCAIASGEFFREDNVLSRYLSNVGCFPHNHPRLFQLLAAQILRGRKVIIFPEGGMVKDHRVMDVKGHYSVYSRLTGERRKHHTGAAVLAQGLEIFKEMIRTAYQEKNHAQLVRWKEQLELDSLDQLLTSALKPTLIIPSNITFYPIRTSENLLLTSVELFSGGLSMRQTEELLVEGNIIFRNTDMDIRMGTPVNPQEDWSWSTKALQDLVAAELTSLDDIFTMPLAPKNWKHKLLGSLLKASSNMTRNRYMEEIYANVTINLSHLASTLIMHCIENGQLLIERQRFYNALYIGVKKLQTNTSIHLHRSLLNPNYYRNLNIGTNQSFEHFINVAKLSDLIVEEGEYYRFLPKLLEEHDFDLIRLENLIAVYNNEAEPIAAIGKTMIAALAECDRLDPEELAGWRFEDEQMDLKWELHKYTKPIYEDINDHETATEDPSPFLLQPVEENGIGVLLIHGLLASPSEMKGYGVHLMHQGYTVMGVRLKGHGSSPYALRDQSWEDWYTSVVNGFEILKLHCRKIVVTGFSTGGALALKLASENRPEILGVSAAAVPLKFINPTFMLIPFLHGTNKFVDWVSSYEGVKPFLENVSEHPHVNYRNVPVRCLYELRLLIQHLDEFLPKIEIPVLITHGDQDPVVSVKSAPEIMQKIRVPDRQLKILKSKRHGIIMENIDGMWKINDDFIIHCTSETKAAEFSRIE
ncbi:alpha/beta fold hydrolase [Methylomicrobium sp. RS1]|jgi:esterase/lipase|uniref:alpha/beta fold hydrolase n=1 Tax=Candidatus Methylomicrobium oryzae TaxID=2802053 RepID=UPI0019213EF9|nr:alpha/beta fold hydrolase [Methylomicrobium sp. RS1]MBL1264181.1 alpha/beta fold hydrolase [Methylomicrobium sp. RS1]